MMLVKVGLSSPLEILALVIFFIVFLTWMVVKAMNDDEEKEAVEKLGKRRRLKRKVKKVKARVKSKMKKGEKK